MIEWEIFVHARVSGIYGLTVESQLRVGYVHENLCSLIYYTGEDVEVFLTRYSS